MIQVIIINNQHSYGFNNFQLTIEIWFYWTNYWSGHGRTGDYALEGLQGIPSLQCFEPVHDAKYGLDSIPQPQVGDNCSASIIIPEAEINILQSIYQVQLFSQLVDPGPLIQVTSQD